MNDTTKISMLNQSLPLPGLPIFDATRDLVRYPPYAVSIKLFLGVFLKRLSPILSDISKFDACYDRGLAA